MSDKFNADDSEFNVSIRYIHEGLNIATELNIARLDQDKTRYYLLLQCYYLHHIPYLKKNEMTEFETAYAKLDANDNMMIQSNFWNESFKIEKQLRNSLTPIYTQERMDPRKALMESS